jgi:hypothetical protein
MAGRSALGKLWSLGRSDPCPTPVPCRAKLSLINWGDPGTDRFPNGNLVGPNYFSQPATEFRPLSHPETSRPACANIASSPALPFRGAPVTRVADDGFPRLCMPSVRQAGTVQIASRGSCSGSVISDNPPSQDTTPPHSMGVMLIIPFVLTRRLPDVGFLARCPELHNACSLPHHDRGQHCDMEGQGRRQVLCR